MSTSAQFVMPHPVHQVYDGIIDTYSGKKLSLINPQPEQICLLDIAKGLSNVCRFGGQIKHHSSVAKHSILVWFLSPDHLKPAALLHDASEAYLGDVIKPLKVLLGDAYAAIEDYFMRVIATKYHVRMSDLVAVKAYDKLALELEHAFHRDGDRRLLQIYKQFPIPIADSLPFNQLLYLFYETFGHDELIEEGNTITGRLQHA